MAKATKKTGPKAKPSHKVAKPPAAATKKANITAKKPVAAKAPEAPKVPKVKGMIMLKAEREAFKKVLFELRDKVNGQISFLANDSLNRADETPTEDRTDDFDREFALNLVSSEHDVLYEINEALRRIEEGNYGTCEACSGRIEKNRLHALPFAKLCLRCQSDIEKGRVRFRPLGGTIFQVVERPSEQPPAEEEETE